jgi:hypothetical protein
VVAFPGTSEAAPTNAQFPARLEDALRAAREPDLSTMGVPYVQFLLDGQRAEKVGRTIGFPRPPC